MWLLVIVPKIKLDNDYSVLQVNDILLPLWQCQNNEGQPQVSADPVPHEIQEMWVYIYIYIYIYIIHYIQIGQSQTRICPTWSSIISYISFAKSCIGHLMDNCPIWDILDSFKTRLRALCAHGTDAPKQCQWMVYMKILSIFSICGKYWYVFA